MNYGKIEIGTVRKTEGQVKKLYTQMTIQEIKYLDRKLAELDKNTMEITQHLEDKHINKNINLLKNLPTMKHKIIEYNETPLKGKIDKRVVIQALGKFRVNIDGKMQDCKFTVVYSLTNNRVITSWYNAVGDNHKTINMKRYNKDLRIIS